MHSLLPSFSWRAPKSRLEAREHPEALSLADGCLVRMMALDQKSVVLTFDGDFGIYRRNRRRVVPTISPCKGSG
jgi:hypothetical protein